MENNTVFETDEYNICLRIRHLDLLISRARRSELEHLDITPPQIGILHFTQQSEGPFTVLDLRKKMLHSNSSVMALLKRMESKGLLKREKDPLNRKYTRIILLKKGKQVYREAMNLNVFNTIVSVLPEKDKKQLKQSIETLIESAERYAVLSEDENPS